MSFFCDSYPILEKSEIANGIFSYVIQCPEAASAAKAGQFVHVGVEGFTLRRPISICEADKDTLRIVFEVRGAGTDKLSKLNVVDKMNMIAPLGNGFTIKDIPEDKTVIVVGGGIGVPPMLQTAKSFPRNRVKAVIGFRSKDRVILEDDFKRIGADVSVCTDDGSYGEKGLVTFPLIEELEKGSTAMIYACGPTPMLKAIVNTAKLYNVPCEVSLEQRMACGVGACVGCAVNINRGGRDFVLRVCKDGPVFKAEEVVL